MLFDAATPEREAFARMFDVCVIGSGPAGITLARRLAAQGLDVALMEAGGVEWSAESQDIYVGENTGLDYHDLDTARLRFFGGTSGHWNGLCRAQDADIFKPNPLNPLSGWPIAKTDLDPYAAETAVILDLDPPEPDPPPEPPGGDFREIYFRRSLPTRFGEKYLDEITAAERIWLGVQANLVDLRLDTDLSRVTGAVFKSYAPADPGFTVQARAYCLCAGGIENPRLLLNFRGQMPAGIGNGNDLVGRFFCDHPGLYLGEVLLEAPVAGEDPFYLPVEAFRTEQDILSLSLRLHPRPPRRMSFLTEAARSLQCNLPFTEALAEAVLGGKPPRCDLGGLAEYRRSLTPERYPWALLTTNSEQSLNPDSRVMLGAARDPLGLNRCQLRWELRPIDYRTVKVSTLAFAQALAENGIGRLRIYDWLLVDEPSLPRRADNLGAIGSWHHMCTTRMSADPATGVVDGDCRMHGIGNLYLGGSSVFATAGYANPTYTIIQLALRLGDHLGRELRA